MKKWNYLSLVYLSVSFIQELFLLLLYKLAFFSSRTPPLQTKITLHLNSYVKYISLQEFSVAVDAARESAVKSTNNKVDPK